MGNKVTILENNIYDMYLMYQNMKSDNLLFIDKKHYIEKVYLYIDLPKDLKNNDIRNFKFFIKEKNRNIYQDINVSLDISSSKIYFDKNIRLYENNYFNDQYEIVVRYDSNFRIKHLLLIIESINL